MTNEISNPVTDEVSDEAVSISPPYQLTELEEQLARFQALVQTLDPTERIELDYEWAWRFKGGESQFHLGVSVMIHGDEVGPLVGLLDMMETLHSGRLTFPGTFTCFIGNPEAARLQKRFVDVDLNRVFERTDLQSEAVIPHEVRRAQKLMARLDEFDLYIDFHQTILESAQPFYICPWQKEAWYWMRLMGGAKVWVTRNPEIGGGGFKCADEYVRQRGYPSIALELGALGFSTQARSGVWRSLSRVMNAVTELMKGDQELSVLAMSQPELQFYETRVRYPFDLPALTLAPGWVNFAPVKRGELLTDSSHSVALESHQPSTEILARYAEEEGALLFPKYPPRNQAGLALDPRPSELCRIVTLLEGHPLDLWEPKETVQEETVQEETVQEESPQTAD